MSRFLEQAALHKIIPVITIDNPFQAKGIGQVLKDNGLPVAEIVLRTPEALRGIEVMKEYHPEIYIGAGTVKNPLMVIDAVKAGADFIVSPAMNQATVVECQAHGIEIIAGVNNPTAIEQGLNMGLTTFKFFPAEASGGVNMVKALLAPYTEINLMPTGGINPNNLHDYLDIERVVCCGGSWFMDSELIKGHRWNALGKLIDGAVKLVNKEVV